jgi:serine/threonine protein kinase
MLLGTPAFIAPEQGRGDRVDSRSDQYSLGVILFLLETGRLPFEADSPMGTVLMHIQKPVPRPSRFNPKLPMAVERVILKSLAKDPDYRYPSVGALYQAYQAALEGASAADLDFPTASVSRDGQLHEESEVYQSPKPKGFLQKPPRREWLWALGVLAAAVAAFLGGSHLIDRLGGSLPWQLRQVEQVPTQISLPPSTEPSPTVVKTPSPIPPLTSANCPGVSIFAPVASGNDVSWTIVNEEPTAIELVELSTIEFPEANEKLVQVRLGSEVLWEGEAWKGQEKFIRDSDRSIAPGMTRRLTLRFYYAAVPHGYRLEANFGQDCVLMGSW